METGSKLAAGDLKANFILAKQKNNMEHTNIFNSSKQNCKNIAGIWLSSLSNICFNNLLNHFVAIQEDNIEYLEDLINLTKNILEWETNQHFDIDEPDNKEKIAEYFFRLAYLTQIEYHKRYKIELSEKLKQDDKKYMGKLSIYEGEISE